ncbi:MAG: NADH pyrophosphatase NudC (nudix superfamily) [Candidatus Azotimanducaceae bacterium]|jgi:NADH pyrophosphatase NudC (nudix superfamily)
MRYSVSKAIIVVERETGSRCLMSAKRDPGRDNDGKLEFLGGRIESGESPLEALLRELSEEEASGNLSIIARCREMLHVEHRLSSGEHQGPDALYR